MSDYGKLMKIVQSRRSVRRFRDEPVSREVLYDLVEAAAWAPTAMNRQDWLFTVVTSNETKLRMAEAVTRRWEAIVRDNADLGGIEELERYAARFDAFAAAPAVVVVSCLKPAAVQEHLLGVDAHAAVGSAASAAMAAQNLMLAAHAHGLGSCCMTGPVAAAEELAGTLNLDRRREIICLIAVGAPDETPPPPPRKPMESIVRFIE